MDFSRPRVMGILNATPDSFFAGSRVETERDIARRAEEIVAEGGEIIDVGGFSTRPGFTEVSEEEETARLARALTIVRRTTPDVAVSVDTFRPTVARRCVEDYGADIINDVGCGNGCMDNVEAADEPTEMFREVARLGVPYILMSALGELRPMVLFFTRCIDHLRSLGAKDIILDPGFGFGKTLEQNFRLLNELDRLTELRLPLLVGVSRKRMAWQTVGSDIASSLNATTAINTIALMRGASVLRVHDVRAAVEAVKIVGATTGNAQTDND